MEHALEILARIFSFTAIRYFVLAGIPFILCYRLLTDRLKKNKIQGRFAGKRDFTREILHSVQSIAVFALVSYLTFATPFSHLTQAYQNISDYPSWWFVLSILLCLVIHDTYFYWMHRLLHHKKLFRLTHVVHHASTNPSPWASYSFHFIESCTEGFIVPIIVLIIPVHPLAILFFTITSFVLNVYGHLGYELLPRRFRRSISFEIFNSSVYHNLHHSKFKGNYGLYFRIWDRLMKTENPDYIKEFDRVHLNRFGPEVIDEINEKVQGQRRRFLKTKPFNDAISGSVSAVAAV